MHNSICQFFLVNLTALRKTCLLIYRHPALTWQQATNELSSSAPATDIATMMQQRDIPEDMKSYVEWTSKPTSVDPCYMTLSNLPESMTSVCVSSDNQYFGTGGLDCLVHLYEMSTGKVILSVLMIPIAQEILPLGVFLQVKYKPTL